MDKGISPTGGSNPPVTNVRHAPRQKRATPNDEKPTLEKTGSVAINRLSNPPSSSSATGNDLAEKLSPREQSPELNESPVHFDQGRILHGPRSRSRSRNISLAQKTGSESEVISAGSNPSPSNSALAKTFNPSNQNASSDSLDKNPLSFHRSRKRTGTLGIGVLSIPQSSNEARREVLKNQAPSLPRPRLVDTFNLPDMEKTNQERLKGAIPSQLDIDELNFKSDEDKVEAKDPIEVSNLKKSSQDEAIKALNEINDIREAQERGRPKIADGKPYEIPTENQYGVTTWRFTLDGKQYEVNEFSKDAYNEVKTEGFIKRQELLVEAAKYYLKEKSKPQENGIAVLTPEKAEEIKQKIVKLADVCKEYLENECKIDPEKIKSIKPQPKMDDSYYHEIHKKAEERLAQLAKDIQFVVTNSSIPEIETFDLKTLEEYEKKYVIARGRPIIINTFHIKNPDGNGTQKFVSMQTPMSENMLPSTVRDREGLANYVRTSFGVVDEAVDEHGDKSAEVNILYSGLRHSSYPPIAIENNEAREAIAANNVLQNLTEVTKIVLANTSVESSKEHPLKIPLRTMMLLTAKTTIVDQARNYTIKPLAKVKKGESETTQLVATKWKGESETMQLTESVLALRTFNNRSMELNINGKPVWIKPDISCMNLGANYEATSEASMSFIPNTKVQDAINARGYNVLENDVSEGVETLLKSLEGITGLEETLQAVKRIISDKPTKILGELEQLHKECDKKLADLYSLLKITRENYLNAKNDPDNKTDIKDLLAEMNNIKGRIAEVEEKFDKVNIELLKAYEQTFNENEEIIRKNLNDLKAINPKQISEDKMVQMKIELVQKILILYVKAKRIFHKKEYLNPQQVMDFQVTYNLLQEILNQIIEFFCKSAEDRTGRVDDKMQEEMIFHHLSERFPDRTVDRKPIAMAVHQFSASQNNTEENSGARGLQIGAKVNEGIPATRGKLHAGLAKQVFKKASKMEPSDQAKRVLAAG